MPILQRQATITIEAALIQYKKAAERLQDGSLNDSERTHIIWNLAHIGDVMNPAELARVKTALNTLYPHLFASLQTITYDRNFLIVPPVSQPLRERFDWGDSGTGTGSGTEIRNN